jgi:Ca2+-binding RTX toxin-like protein
MIHGGDGDDQIYMGDDWRDGIVYGENDNDTIHIGEGIRRTEIEAGEGDDTVTVILEDDIVQRPRKEVIRGQGGNDRLNG